MQLVNLKKKKKNDNNNTCEDLSSFICITLIYFHIPTSKGRDVFLNEHQGLTRTQHKTTKTATKCAKHEMARVGYVHIN